MHMTYVDFNDNNKNALKFMRGRGKGRGEGGEGGDYKLKARE